MCGRGYVWAWLCVGVVMCGRGYVWVWLCVGVVKCGCGIVHRDHMSSH